MTTITETAAGHNKPFPYTVGEYVSIPAIKALSMPSKGILISIVAEIVRAFNDDGALSHTLANWITLTGADEYEFKAFLDEIADAGESEYLLVITGGHGLITMLQPLVAAKAIKRVRSRESMRKKRESDKTDSSD